MAVKVHVVLKNQAGSEVATLTDWRSLSVIHTVNGLSSFVLKLDDQNQFVSLFEKDGQIEIYRSDLENSLPKYKEFEGVIRAFQYQFTEDKHGVFIVKGRGYNDLLARRIIAYQAGTIYSEKSAVAQTVLRGYVNENAGPAAISPPRLRNGVIAGLSIETGTPGGPVWSGARAYRNLMDICVEVGNATGYDFDVIGIGDALYEFRTYAGQRGSDRSINGLNHATGKNAAGNSPVIFSLEWDNMKNPNYEISSLNEINCVFVLGQGAETARVIEIITNAPAIATTPINLRELSRDARNEATLAGLDDRGDALLVENATKETLTFDYKPSPACLYGKNFTWGDMITAQYRGVPSNFNKKIVGATLSYQTPDIETITFDLADIPPKR